MLNYITWVPAFLQSAFAFIIILVPLVVFHEFGHFVFAKLFGVKAEIFSVGFGPKLWSKQFGETELRISAIPMGGYVKLLGEDRDAELSPAEMSRALHKQKAWKRFFIFFGGPLFNFLLAIVIFMAILAIGEPQLSSVAGRIVHGSPAERAGFISGDRILAINEEPVTKFEEVIMALNESPGKSLDFTVQHRGAQQPVHLTVQPVTEEGFSIYGENAKVGEIPGLSPLPRGNQVGVSNSKSASGRAGLSTGDQILEFNKAPVANWEDLEANYDQLEAGADFSLTYQKAKAQEKQQVQWRKPAQAKGLSQDFGLFSSELFVDKTVPKAPAAEAGLSYGDRLVSVNRHPVQSFFELKDLIQSTGEREGKVSVQWERNGLRFSAEMIPTATAGRDPVLKKTTTFTIGVIPLFTVGEPATTVERILNPFKLLYKGTERMIVFSWRNLVSLGKMVNGDVSMGAIGGPLMIGKIAGESLARGLIVFLTNMAIFSVGLGVLNILPVPVLDGGHLLLLGVESLRGKPLTLRQMEVVQGIGLVLILALMGVAFSNDISRLFFS